MPPTSVSKPVDPVTAHDGSIALPLDGGETAPVSENATPPTGLLSGFDFLVNYLGLIADYLEQTASRLRDMTNGESSPSGLRLDIPESFRLDVLRAVMAAKIPDERLEPRPGPSSAIEAPDSADS